ncbi:MAG: LD-carboxypeptidase [Defluviitaleaceae bacterium]|nr:LD-carboxypeptidase [Defluviitaleaceae bacterium]
MSKKKWVEPLERGDRVALIAPSTPPESPQLVDYAVKFVTELGFEPVVYDSCYADYGYLAGSDELRARDINLAFADDAIRGIMCVRGGYGLQRLLPIIDFDMVKANPKFFSGYSDITALHSVIPEQAGFITYHTPMLATPKFAAADEYTVEQFKRQMFGHSEGKIENPKGHEWEFLQVGEGIGELCGGNLAIIASSLGTPYEIQTAGKILFIEEVEEPPYKIDRMLNQLHLAGKLSELSGVVFGDFADCVAPEPKLSLTIPEIIENLGLKVPVLWNFRCGHCYPTASLPMGAVARLNSAQNLFEIVQ